MIDEVARRAIRKLKLRITRLEELVLEEREPEDD